MISEIDYRGACDVSAIARSLTVEDLESLPNDGRRYEIVTGKFFMSPAPDKSHQVTLVALALALGNHVAMTSDYQLLIAPVDVRFSILDQVQPDLLLIRKNRMSIYQGSTVFGSPDLVIEIISPSSRTYDEVVKFELYERHEVPEYWLVDPLARSIKVMALRNGRYEQRSDNDDTLSSALLPALTLDISTIFADLEV